MRSEQSPSETIFMASLFPPFKRSPHSPCPECTLSPMTPSKNVFHALLLVNQPERDLSSEGGCLRGAPVVLLMFYFLILVESFLGLLTHHIQFVTWNLCIFLYLCYTSI